MSSHLQNIIHLYYIHFTGKDAATNNKVNEMKLATLIAMQVPRDNIAESATHFAQSIGDSDVVFRVDQFGSTPEHMDTLVIVFDGEFVAPPVSVDEIASDIKTPITRAELMAEYDRIEAGESEVEDSEYVVKLPEVVKKTLFVSVYIGTQYPNLLGEVIVYDYDPSLHSNGDYLTIKSEEVEIPLGGKMDLRTGMIDALTNKLNKLKADYYIADKAIADQIDNLQALENK